MGEAVMRDVAKRREHDIVLDSAGTGAYHEGEDPDDRYVFQVSSHARYLRRRRAVATCKKVGQISLVP